MYAKVYNSITEVDEKAWDAIVENNRLICTHKYLEAIEKSEINDCRYYYPVLYEDGEIIAHTCVYFISTELDTFAQGITKKTINIIRRFWKTFLVMTSVECGSPVALGNTFSFRDGVDRIRLLTQLCEKVESLARALNVGMVLFRDFRDDELHFYDHLNGLGYTRINNLPSTRIRIRWGSFDEYLNAMRSHYKSKVVRHAKRFQRDGINVHIIRDFSEHAEALEMLWSNAYNNATEYRREKLPSRFFVNIDRFLGDRSAVIYVKKGNLPIGFCLLLMHDRTLTPLFCGLDYDYNENHSTYFNLLYRAVEFGIAQGMEDIDLGITTLEPKKQIGAEVVTLSMYMKHLNPLMNRILPKLFDMMIPKQDCEQRVVFKVSSWDDRDSAVAGKT